VGRRRTKNKDLPQRVYLKHGRYWFIDYQAKWHDLGTDKAEMYRNLARFVDRAKPLHTMRDVFDRFILEKIPLLAPRTQSDYRGYIENLRPAFGDAAPDEPTAGDVFEYRNKRAESSVTQANREKSCLSSVFTAAIEWKLRTDNPCRLVPKLSEAERDRYVFDHEYLAVYDLAPLVMQEVSGQVMQCLMDLATITGQREGDLLRLPCNDPHTYAKEGIVFRPNKSKRRHPRHGKIIETGKMVIIEWSDELHTVVHRLRALGPRLRPTLVCNQDGKPYTESGFRSNWHRLMQAAVKGTKNKDGTWITEPALAQPFTFHDLRAKRASDAEDVLEANNALAHDDVKTTQKIYRRKPRRARAGAKITTALNV